jgi:histone-lysine N-methyltransferase SETMAR
MAGQYLKRIVTADETWVHHYEPESEARSMAWKRPTSPVAKKFKVNHKPVRLCLQFFLDMEGVIFVHFTPKGETVNSQNYCDVLRAKLKPAIRSKRRRKLQMDAILLHDNARPHAANQTVESVKDSGPELMENPPHSPDLVPSDFHMFGPMKEALKGGRFSSDEEVIGGVKNLLKTQSKTSFLTELRKPVKLWNRCTEVEGDYFEK